ncbi:MAG: amidohydrolase family protein, partial [Casimicrobium sp.]
LGSDVGGGTGFSLLKEGLEAYQTQMLRGEMRLEPAQLLYLATRAGAAALLLEDQIGCFRPGLQADCVVLRPAQGSTLEATLRRSPNLEATLAALFTLAREETVRETWVAGECIYRKSL